MMCPWRDDQWARRCARAPVAGHARSPTALGMVCEGADPRHPGRRDRHRKDHAGPELIHRLSGRLGPFLATSVAELDPNLQRSQIFGHEKGAFSSRHSRRLLHYWIWWKARGCMYYRAARTFFAVGQVVLVSIAACARSPKHTPAAAEGRPAASAPLSACTVPSVDTRGWQLVETEIAPV